MPTPANSQAVRNRRVSDHSVVAYIKDRILPPLLVAFIVSSVGIGTAAYRKLDQVSSEIAAQSSRTTALESRQSQLEADLSAVKQSYVTRAEILETVKRVEQNQEIMMLRFKIESTRSRP